VGRPVQVFFSETVIEARRTVLFAELLATDGRYDYGVLRCIRAAHFPMGRVYGLSTGA